MAKKKKVFYRLFDTEDGAIALVDEKYKWDFWREAVYDVPLEYPHIFKITSGTFEDYFYTNAQPAFTMRLREIIEK